MVKKAFIKFTSYYFSLRIFLKDVRRRIESMLTALSALTCLTVLILLLLQFGFPESQTNIDLYVLIHNLLIKIFIFDIGLRWVLNPKKVKFFFNRPTDLVVLFPLFIYISQATSEISFFSSQCVLVVLLCGRFFHLRMLLTWFHVKPAQILLLAFLFIIFIGSLLLSLPISASLATEQLPFIDALFTSFSAVCVTGLTVNSVGQDLSLFGQAILLVLIQIGGLGIMSFSVLITLFLKRKVSQVASIELQENYSTLNLGETFSAIRFIFKFTILFELIGALILFILWKESSVPLLEQLFYAVFHSVSAFCNAGFSLFENSLTQFATDPFTSITIACLIILGGLGFPVLYNLFTVKQNGSSQLKLSTKLALWVTGLLIAFGTGSILVSEFYGALAPFSLFDKVLISFFHSVSARTAGFNTIDLNGFSSTTLVIFVVLMIIGASPGSTGGGIKTTTFGVICLSLINVIKASFRVDYAKKTIANESILKAFSLLLISLFLIIIGYITLINVMDTNLFSLFFETASAFGTVGFSLGATHDLSFAGKFIIMGMMFVGRIGLFTFLIAFFQKQKKPLYHYPEEKLNIL